MRLCTLTEGMLISNNTIRRNQLNMEYFIVLFVTRQSNINILHYHIAGKPEDLSNEANAFYVTGTDEYSKYLVENFNCFNLIKDCNISVDCYFTSTTLLADWAITKHFSIVGTMCLDRKGIAKEIKSMEGREEKSTIYAYQSNGDSLLVSYVDKNKAGKKNIIVLTTMHTSML